ncbi:CU044_5270 family protein [Actinomadura parmotrematis]|uniref:CU044_5270 family protein n=1 Tax=Actinomadura parmotrematis TaxID=2864039 RepID=A0ABS7FZ63_9ACTN|nr:CU044_5270 family protein [Actinomadura parmotrematis]MBW8485732.1 CU044_5270 family protein [Actinomadura parmotrematis]
MDDLDALRGLRTALAEEESPDRLAERVEWRRAVPARRRRAGMRLPLLSAAAAGVVAAGAVAVLALPHGGARAPSGGTAAPPVTGRAALLVAATSAAKAPGGAYWHYRRTWGDVFGVGKTRAAFYKVDSRQVFEAWLDRNGNQGARQAGPVGRPLTAADAARWRADGAKHMVPVYEEGLNAFVEMGDLPALRPWPPLGKADTFNGLTAAQIAALPTEPGALRDRLLHLRGSWRAVEKKAAAYPIGELRGTDRVRALTQVAGDLLSTWPAPPGVRAAAFRMLAALPGVEAGGTGTDPLGRSGTVVSLPVASTVELGLHSAPVQLGSYRREWVIDPAKGALLAIQDRMVAPPRGSRKMPPGDDGKPRSLRAKDMPERFFAPGDLTGYQVFEDTGWTDGPPPVKVGGGKRVVSPRR